MRVIIQGRRIASAIHPTSPLQARFVPSPPQVGLLRSAGFQCMKVGRGTELIPVRVPFDRTRKAGRRPTLRNPKSLRLGTLAASACHIVPPANRCENLFPTGMAARLDGSETTIRANGYGLLERSPLPVPVGGLPTGAGESPASPQGLNHLISNGLNWPKKKIVIFRDFA